MAKSKSKKLISNILEDLIDGDLKEGTDLDRRISEYAASKTQELLGDQKEIEELVRAYSGE